MRTLFIVGALVLSGISQMPLFAQKIEILNQLEEAYPGLRFHENNGVVNTIFGTALSTGETPLDSAINHLNNWQRVYGEDVGTFVPQATPSGETLVGVMPNAVNGEYKFYTFRFRQIYGGLPVFRSGVGFLVRNSENNPLVMTGFDVKEMNGFDAIGGGIAQANVTPAMLENVRRLMDSAPDSDLEMQSVLEEPVQTNSGSITGVIAGPLAGVINRLTERQRQIDVSEEELVIWAGINNVREEPKLAISFVARRGSVQTYPHYDKYLVVADANSGEILLAEDQITNFDVEGTVRGRATDGLASMECDPEAAFLLPYAEVSVEGGSSVFADASGGFVIPHGGSAEVSVTSRLRGRWFEVFDQSAGNSIPEIVQQVSPPGPANFLHNPNENQEFPTANVNAYLEANRVRDFVLSYEPAFPTISTQQFFEINTNINSTCNAFYDGSSINFYRAGGGCSNTSASDVVYHEYGHHLVAVTGNGQGQFGEGAGDCIGVLIEDEPILGQGFQGNCNAGIRSADNNLQYPCNGEIHDCGRLISACVWSTRNQLVVTEPSSYRDISASLFLGMMIVRGQMQPGNTTIDPGITILYLELDDDDDNIGNGTPHYQEIAAGFGAHNLDAPELQLLEFEYSSGRPDQISPGGGVAFSVDVIDLIENHESGSAILHVDRGQGFEAFPMTEVAAGRYEADFPTSPCATELKYYVSADTTESNTQTSPGGAPESFFTALSADSVTTVFADNFNTDLGWNTTGDAVDGQWGRGVPLGGGDRGDPAADEDGSGSCYITDNTDGNSDVDDGSTILTSPLLDAAAQPASIPVLSYSRWYSNNQGNAPEADIFSVDISNDGGSTWTNLETVGPGGVEVRGGWIRKTFRISDFVTPTDQMQVRFVASDLGEGSIVEAGVDAFELLQVGCSQVVTADSVEITGGTIVDGELADLDASDNQRMMIRGMTRPRVIKAVFTGISPAATPNTMQFRLETRSAVFGSRILQKVEMFNYNSNQYEVIDLRGITYSESAAIMPLIGDLSRFVEPETNTIEARVSFERSSRSVRGSGIFGPISVELDELSWEVGG